MRHAALCLFLFAAAGCAPALPPVADQDALPTPQEAAQIFADVVQRVEPVAQRMCRARLPGGNCDYLIVVDSRPQEPANAFQTVTPLGQPVIVLTLALVGEVRNGNELAFVLGHEAAHHMAGHIGRSQDGARRGAVLAGALAAAGGADVAEVIRAQDAGAQVGARAYSQQFEREADALGTEIALRAGFDPLIGARYFARLPDVQDPFLATHPPNAARADLVRRTLDALREQGI